MTVLSTRRRLAVLAVTASTVAISAAAVSSPAQAATTYYSAVSSCAAPAPGHSGCFAMKRVRVAKSAPGARAAAARKPGVTGGPNGGFTPSDLAKAYGVNPATATTQTVAIVDAYNDPNARADLNTFDANYGLDAETASSLTIVGQTGSTTALPTNDNTMTGGWSIEESLDLDAVRGLCNKCKIILVETNSNSNADLAAGVNTAVSLGANEVSNSYGGVSDSSDPTTAAEIAAYNHKGVVITASTGDDGYYDWDNANYRYASPAPPAGSVPTMSSNDAATPAAFSSVVAVGGTTLQLNDDGTRAGESVWNENGTFDNAGFQTGAPQGATGGGCSVLYKAAKWQSSTANYSAAGCNGNRLAADVSALADPNTGYDIYDSFQVSGTNSCTPPNCWATYGGTSLSSPLIASMWGLAGGAKGISYPSLALYGHFKAADKSLYDVTVGGNGFCGGTSTSACGAPFKSRGGSPNNLGNGLLDCAWSDSANPATVAVGTRACKAAVGYDGPSGVGTPNGLTPFTPLALTAAFTVPASVTHGKAVTLSAASSKDPYPGGVLSYKWSFGSTSVSPKYTFARAAVYTVTLKVTDNYGQTASLTKKITVK